MGDCLDGELLCEPADPERKKMFVHGRRALVEPPNDTASTILFQRDQRRSQFAVQPKAEQLFMAYQSFFQDSLARPPRIFLVSGSRNI